MRASLLCVVASLVGIACGSAPHESSPPASSRAPAAPSWTTAPSVTALALPGGGPDGVAMDYLLYDPRTNSVWVPAGNTGAVDVVDAATGKIARIDGFATREIERNGVKHQIGPGAAALGDRGTVYIGNRGDSTVCAVDETTLAKGACATLDAAPDGVAYVARTREVWVTTPRDRSIRVLDGTTLAQKARIALDGRPEGFAPDNTRGRFYTNLEDKGATLAIDLESRTPVAQWQPGCDADGPRGLRLAEPEGVLLVACNGRLVSLDAAHDGAQLGALDIGNGVDDFDYTPPDHRVYTAAADTGLLTIATLDPHGGLSRIASVTTRPGARNGVVARDGRVYLADSHGSSLVIVAP